MERIVLAYPHKLLRNGLKMLLEQQPQIVVASEVASIEELLQNRKISQAKLLMADYNLRAENDSVIKQLRTKNPALKVLWLADPADYNHLTNQTKKQGIRYLNKDAKPLELYRSVKRMLKLKEASKTDTQTHSVKKLSKRENEVLRLLCAGLNNRAIAEEMKLNEKTISTYKQRILTKIGGNSVVDIYEYAQKKKLVVKA